jgi:hypothetical protein
MRSFYRYIVREYCPDLNLLDIPTTPDDFFWYAERVNGRVAMLAMTSLLMAEFATHQSIFQLVGIFN